MPAGTGTLDDLTGLAGGPVDLEHAEQVGPEGLGERVGAGTEQRRVAVAAPGRTGSGDDLGPGDGVRQQPAERELGR